jgi:asparagine synthase (glutamine-hydrolysing)
MCGIWALIGNTTLTYGELFEAFMKIKNRGPDRSEFFMVSDILPVYVGFHRLAIMDPTSRGDQPFTWEKDGITNYCICNGEIYNFRQLIEKYDLKPKSKSDCEIIPLLFEKIGMDKMLDEFCGEFSFIIFQLNHSIKKVKIYAATDPCSVRPLFYLDDDKYIGFSSELISLLHDKKPIFGDVKRFPSGHVMEVNIDERGIIDRSIKPYFTFDEDPELIKSLNLTNYESARKAIHDVLCQCIDDRLHADRPVGAFSSGGVDSGIVCARASYTLKENKKEKLSTFSIGLEGSTDKLYAEIVAKHIDAHHTLFEKSEDDFIEYQKLYVIKNNGSYDNTTSRASTGQDLCSYEIAQSTDIKVVLSGDGSDELLGGYMENHRCPNEEEFRKNQIKRISDIHYFDGLRVDRGVSQNGLEARTPFLDKRFVKLCLSIPAKFLMPFNGIEKYILRDAFRDYLPEIILFRPKEAFSDGVSSVKRSWYQIVQENALKTHEDWKEKAESYEFNSPYSPETLYYRELFEKTYGNHESVVRTIPYFWLPNWSDGITEPSARVLDVYKKRMT